MSVRLIIIIIVVVLPLLAVCPATGTQSIMQKFLSGQTFIFDSLFQNNQKNFQRAYDEINEVLLNVVDTDDVEENIKAVRRWIKHFTDDIKEQGSSYILQALFQLEALSDEDPELCSRSSHDTLVANEKATREFLKKLTKPKQMPRRRVDKIVYYYAKKQAKDCEFHYLSEFELHGADLTQISYDRVTQFMTDLIVSRLDETYLRRLKINNKMVFIDRKPFEANKLAQTIRFKSKDHLRDGRIAFNWLRRFASQANEPLLDYLNKIMPTTEARQKARVDQEKLRLLFDTYLLKPCEEYVDKLRSAFADDLSIMKVMSRPAKDVMDDDMAREFYKHASYWHACDRLIKEKDIMFANLKRWINKTGQIVHLDEEQ